MKQRNEDRPRSRSPWSRPKPDFVAGEQLRKLQADRSSDPRLRSREERRRKASLDKATADIESAIKRASMPPWLIPAIALVLVLVVVFFVPQIHKWLSADSGTGIVDEHTKYVSIYADNVRVVNVPVATLYREPDIKADRIGQVLFNSPVQVNEVEAVPTGFVHVTTLDGRQGYMRPDELSTDRQSIEPDLYTSRIVVTDLQKSVMTHASKGNLLIEVKRGTTLFVLYDGNDLYRVQLPDGKEGWVSATGVFQLPAKVDIPVSDHEAFTSYVLAFDQAKLMEHGLTNEGIDMAGVLTVTAQINGVRLSGDAQALSVTGATVENAVDDAGRLDTNLLQAGDVIYFKSILSYDENHRPIVAEEISKIGIWLGDDQILTDLPRDFSIGRQAPEQIFSAWLPVRAARYFE